MYIYHIEFGSDEATVAISTERKNHIKLLMACSRNVSIFPSAKGISAHLDKHAPHMILLNDQMPQSVTKS